MNTNLLDLDNDILNIIGDYVKKDNFEREIISKIKVKEYIQIINGKDIKFYPYFYWSIVFDLKYIFREHSIKDEDTIPKDIIKKNYLIKLIMILII